MNLPEIQLVPERGAMATGEVGELAVLVRITPPAPERAERPGRPPLNLGIALDKSGSMSGVKMDLAREAACSLVSHLGPVDRVSVVEFSNEARVVVPSTPATDVPALQRVLRGIHADGQTALHQGWVEAGLQVGAHLNGQGLNRVILLSDGQANQGLHDPQVLAAQAGELAVRGISTSTFGVGGDYNEILLDGMASRGDGNFYHIESRAQFDEMFGLELHGLTRLFGRRVSLGVEPERGVRVSVRNHLERASTGRWMLPNLIAGLETKVLLQVSVDGQPHEGDMPLFEVRLAWDPPAEGRRRVLRSGLALPAVARARLAEFPSNPEVVELSVLLQVARQKRKATEALRRGDMAEARARLDRALAIAQSAPRTQEILDELADLEHVERYLQMGDVSSAGKASYYQSRQRDSSKSGYSGGRTSRGRDF